MLKLGIITLTVFFMLSIVVSADISYFDQSELYNNTVTNQSTPNFNFRLVYNDSSTSSHCDILINDTGYGFNSSVENNTLTTITANDTLSDGFYVWKLNCTTDDSFNSESIERIFWVDTIVPTVMLVNITPENNSALSLFNANPSFVINATFNDSGNIQNCFAITDGYPSIMTVFDGYCTGTVFNIPEGEIEIFVEVFDGANTGQSDIRTLSIDIVTFIEQNRVFLVIIPLIWSVLALFVFFLWDSWKKLNSMLILQIGFALVVVISLIYSLWSILGLVV